MAGVRDAFADFLDTAGHVLRNIDMGFMTKNVRYIQLTISDGCETGETTWMTYGEIWGTPLNTPIDPSDQKHPWGKNIARYNPVHGGVACPGMLYMPGSLLDMTIQGEHFLGPTKESNQVFTRPWIADGAMKWLKKRAAYISSGSITLVYQVTPMATFVEISQRVHLNDRVMFSNNGSDSNFEHVYAKETYVLHPAATD